MTSRQYATSELVLRCKGTFEEKLFARVYMCTHTIVHYYLLIISMAHLDLRLHALHYKSKQKGKLSHKENKQTKCCIQTSTPQ